MEKKTKIIESTIYITEEFKELVQELEKTIYKLKKESN